MMIESGAGIEEWPGVFGVHYWKFHRWAVSICFQFVWLPKRLVIIRIQRFIVSRDHRRASRYLLRRQHLVHPTKLSGGPLFLMRVSHYKFGGYRTKNFYWPCR